MAKKIKISKKWLIILTVTLIIISGVIGSQAFPRTETKFVLADSGQYCYDTNYKNLLEAREYSIDKYFNCIVSRQNTQRDLVTNNLRSAIEDASWNEVISVRDYLYDAFNFAPSTCNNWIN